MSLRIGIIGLGVMGADHATIINSKTSNSSITAIYDNNISRTEKISKIFKNVDIKKDPIDLINSKNVDAVLIASPDKTHAMYTLECIKKRKFVLCEKPLSPNLNQCKKIIEAETKIGKKLVQVGFMRRFDPAYNEMKKNYNNKKFGKALLFHCIHRCLTPPGFFESTMSITNALVHEFDISRWLLNTEIKSIQIIKSNVKKNISYIDPIMAILKCDNGIIVDVEINQNSNYGYDVKAELLCENGSIVMSPPRNNELLISSNQSFSYPKDWRPRFADAYREQNQSWINSIIHKEDIKGACAWDGMIATHIANIGIKSLKNEKTIIIKLPIKPKLYRK